MDTLVKDLNELITELYDVILKSKDKKRAVFKVKNMIEDNAENHSLDDEDISFISGIDLRNINKSLNNLKKAKLIIVDKIKTSTGKCNSYQLFY